MKKIFVMTTVCLLAAASGLFALSGDEILGKVENALSGPKDYEGRAQMELGNLDGSGTEHRELKMWIAGKNSRVVKFLSPAGIEGIGLLTEEDSSMYLYLPAQNRIRMIAGNIKDQSFQGTDFSYNEMGSYEYRKDYNPEITGDRADTWTLELKRKAGSDRTYDRMIMIVNKSNFIPQEIQLFEKGILKKKMLIMDVKNFGAYLLPVKIRVENLKDNHYTEMMLEDVRFDQGLKNQGVFTKRFLKKRVR